MLDRIRSDDIARRYDLGRDAVLSDKPVARGKQGEIWHLDTSLGSWAVKRSFRPLQEWEIAAAAAFEEAVAASGVRVPRVIRTIDGELLAGVGGDQIRVFEWVDLLPPDITADPLLVGAVVAGIHRVRRTMGDLPDSWYTEAVGADRWDALIPDLNRAEAPFADALAQARNELVELEQWIEPPRRLQTCHRDLWADNLRSTPAGGMCVIDWEGAGLADPSQELACVLFEFASGDAVRVRALYRAYVDAGGPGRVDDQGCFSMLIAQLGHIAEAACRQWLEPTPRSSRADSAASFAEFVDRPHDRAVLGHILDAVGELGPLS